MENFFHLPKWAFPLFPRKTLLSAHVIPLPLFWPLLVWAHCCIAMFGHLKCPFFLARRCGDGHSMCKFGYWGFFLWTYTFDFMWCFVLGSFTLMQFDGSDHPVHALSGQGDILLPFPWQTWNVLLEDTSSFAFTLPRIPVMISLL